MSKQAMFQTPQVVAAELDVSSATLRRWSEEFADYLSPEAGPTKGRSHRRYTDDDIATLGVVKELMNNGMTYTQVRKQLAEQFAIWSKNSPTTSIQESVDLEDDQDELVTAEQEENSLISANGNDATAIEFFTTTLATLSDNQKSILNSQAANRELLGVLIQDNFNLKEENSLLRDRILEVERQLNQVRQEDEWRRESLRQELDVKITNAQQMAAEAISVANTPQEMPEIKAVKTKSGCLGALFGGGGDIQIVSLPRRRGRNQEKQGQTRSPSLSSTASPLQQSPPPAHPKPMTPPE